MAGPSLVDWRWPGDEALFFAINGARRDWLDAVFVTASSRPFGVVLLGAFALALVMRLKRLSALPLLQLGLAIAFTDVCGAQLLKPFIGRLRPNYALPESLVRVLSPAANVGSMPSLHAANAFAAATVVTWAVPRAGVVAFPMALVIAISRVGVGVHWPSDVVVGAVYGSLVATLIVQLSRAWQRRSSPKPSAVSPAGS
jgi:undecaprenyl-diphosphatase